jgi:hypothetical protein
MSVQTKTTVTICFNGEDKEEAYQPHEQVQALLEKALNDFHVSANRHLLGLFTEGGTELQDGQSVATAGVTRGELLFLRQSTVRGG